MHTYMHVIVDIQLHSISICLHTYMHEHTCRLAREKKVPSVSSRENYRKIMRQAEDEIFHHGYDVGRSYQQPVI